MAEVTHEGQIPLTTRQGKHWAVTYAWPAIRKFIVTKPLGAIGGIIILLMVITAICIWDLFEHGPTKTLYLRNNDTWLKATDLKGPWAPAPAAAPKALDIRYL